MGCARRSADDRWVRFGPSLEVNRDFLLKLVHLDERHYLEEDRGPIG